MAVEKSLEQFPWLLMPPQRRAASKEENSDRCEYATQQIKIEGPSSKLVDVSATEQAKESIECRRRRSISEWRCNTATQV